MKSSGIAVLGVILLIAGAFTLVLTQSPPGKGVREAEARCVPSPGHDCLPEMGVVDTTGLAWTNDALAGKVVIVNFWATWCKPCVHEVPLLTATYEEHRSDGLVMLGVVTDDVTDDQLAHFSDKYGLRYPVVRVTPQLLEAFDYPDGLPTTFIFDRHGELVRRYMGPLREQQLDRWLTPLLDAK